MHICVTDAAIQEGTADIIVERVWHHLDIMQGTVDDMVCDVQRGIGWVLDRIEGYGGDRSKVYVMGQSCGGHLAALALIYQQRGRTSIAAAKSAQGDGCSTWQPSDLKVCIQH